MALPIATVPVLDGEAWERFERLRKEDEKKRGTIKLEVLKEKVRAILEEAYRKGNI